MEYTQWENKSIVENLVKGLNPCCNGIYSMRPVAFCPAGIIIVLILVVMEYTQWEREKEEIYIENES